jgi:hypothetical protein
MKPQEHRGSVDRDARCFRTCSFLSLWPTRLWFFASRFAYPSSFHAPFPPKIHPCEPPRFAKQHEAPSTIEEVIPMRAKRLNLQQRQEVFHALVTTQDLGLMSVGESRQHIEKQFEISDSQLKMIEEEGLENEWPPLNEAVQTIG